MTMIYNRARFTCSVAKLGQAPDASGIEIAFIGRSNAGKSSAINAITNNHKLARTSKAPGRTQCINFFTLDNDRWLVDLPGYGYAKVASGKKQSWEQLVARYLRERTSLQGLILIMDVRHPLKEVDRNLLVWCQQSQLPVHILLSKSDKLAKGPANKTLRQVGQALEIDHPAVTVQLFSALKATGVDQARLVLDQWLGL